MPSPLVSRIGKKIAQKTASGSRDEFPDTNERELHERVPEDSERPPNPRGKAAPTDASLVIAQMPSGQRDEDVLERGRMGPQLGERQALAGQLREERRYRAMQLASTCTRTPHRRRTGRRARQAAPDRVDDRRNAAAAPPVETPPRARRRSRRSARAACRAR